jgi:pimeloyl-ACP methyl ester carboxylesterase
LDALNIKKADVLGWSMGGFIAQELVLTHPDKVGKLIIYASICGGKESAPPTPDVLKVFSDQSVLHSIGLKDSYHYCSQLNGVHRIQIIFRTFQQLQKQFQMRL